MKQKTYIIIGLIIVLLLLAVWLFMLFSPKTPAELWNDFNLNGEEDPTITIPPPPVVVEEPVVNMERPRLRQLTTRPVIGFKEVQPATTSLPVIYYAEAGTGHIYTIDIASGKEERVSNTTIPEANYASFSPSGSRVAIRAKNDRRANSFAWSTLSTTSSGLDLQTVDVQADTFSTISNTDVVYTTRGSGGLTAKALNFNSGVTTDLFIIPFFEATMIWGSTTNSTHFVFPKASYTLEGYLYGISKKTMSRLPVDGFGLTAFTAPNHIIYTKMTEFVPKSYIYNTLTNTHASSPFVLLPEKCVASAVLPDTLWCGFDLQETLPITFPDSWYQGTMSFTDTIWEVNLATQAADPLVDTFKESSREIDIISMAIGSSEQALYFINKNDNTLWMYEL